MSERIPPSTRSDAIFVKICGIRDSASATMAAQAGADAIGFVFHKDSARYIAPECAGELGAGPTEIDRVGVFVNAPVDTIAAAARTAALTMIQLHGHEGPSQCREAAERTGCQTIKAIRVRGRDDLEDIARYDVDYVLLDGFDGKCAGGSGKAFDWSMLNATAGHPARMILAGGLTPDNVRRALSLGHPMGVDVSSGVETAGQKDGEKITAFVRAVRQWEMLGC
jgi:phosphoribosylanthranilate isomerase